MQTDDRRDEQTHGIIGAAMKVHSQLGPGLLEPVYQEALAIEFTTRSIPAAREVDLGVRYKGQLLICAYRADFGCVIVELKALHAITGTEQAQLLNYLKATGMERGLLINFGCQSLEWKRMVLSRGPNVRTPKGELSADSAD